LFGVIGGLERDCLAKEGEGFTGVVSGVGTAFQNESSWSNPANKTFIKSASCAVVGGILGGFSTFFWTI
jgi:phage shock protein PspC (stress-responsive transcriptional regulator)